LEILLVSAVQCWSEEWTLSEWGGDCLIVVDCLIVDHQSASLVSQSSLFGMKKKNHRKS
jgi:hypothetical protein